MHLTLHADDRTGHLRSHLPALRTSLRHLALGKSIHVRWHVHHWLLANIVITMRKRASVLVGTLLVSLIVFANVALVIGRIDSYLFLAHQTTNLGSLGQRLAHLRIHRRAWKPGLLLTHVYSLGTAVSTAAWLESTASKVIVTFVCTSEVRLLVLQLESASSRTTASNAAALVASWASPRHTAPRWIIAVEILVRGLAKVSLAVRELTFVAHLAVAIVLIVTAELGLIF